MKHHFLLFYFPDRLFRTLTWNLWPQGPRKQWSPKIESNCVKFILIYVVFNRICCFVKIKIICDFKHFSFLSRAYLLVGKLLDKIRSNMQCYFYFVLHSAISYFCYVYTIFLWLQYVYVTDSLFVYFRRFERCEGGGELHRLPLNRNHMKVCVSVFLKKNDTQTKDWKLIGINFLPMA